MLRNDPAAGLKLSKQPAENISANSEGTLVRGRKASSNEVAKALKKPVEAVKAKGAAVVASVGKRKSLIPEGIIVISI